MFKKLTTGLIAGACLLSACLPIKSNAAESRLLTSYYAHYFHGRTTANGERFNMWANTAASPYLPFGTRLRVCYYKLRGRPYQRQRTLSFLVIGHLDLSYGAASQYWSSGTRCSVDYGYLSVSHNCVRLLDDKV